MYFPKSLIASTLLGLAAATTHAGEMPMASETVHAVPMETGMPAEAGTVNTHIVQVGGPADAPLTFQPDFVMAAKGDLVQFQFNMKNHSIVQSTFDQPCVPITNVMPNKTDAFFSGFMPTNRTFGQTSKAGLLTYTIRVTDDTKPIWFYCSQGMHCQSGMVGAINPPSSGNRTLAAYKQLAEAAPQNLSPGQMPGAAAPVPSSPPDAAASSAAGEIPVGVPTGTGAITATGSSNNLPAQQTVNAAPGHAARDSFLGIGLAGLAAFMAL